MAQLVQGDAVEYVEAAESLAKVLTGLWSQGRTLGKAQRAQHAQGTHSARAGQGGGAGREG